MASSAQGSATGSSEEEELYVDESIAVQEASAAASESGGVKALTCYGDADPQVVSIPQAKVWELEDREGVLYKSELETEYKDLFDKLSPYMSSCVRLRQVPTKADPSSSKWFTASGFITKVGSSWCLFSNEHVLGHFMSDSAKLTELAMDFQFHGPDESNMPVTYTLQEDDVDPKQSEYCRVLGKLSDHGMATSSGVDFAVLRLTGAVIARINKALKKAGHDNLLSFVLESTWDTCARNEDLLCIGHPMGDAMTFSFGSCRTRKRESNLHSKSYASAGGTSGSMVIRCTAPAQSPPGPAQAAPSGPRSGSGLEGWATDFDCAVWIHGVHCSGVDGKPRSGAFVCSKAACQAIQALEEACGLEPATHD